MNWNKFSIKRNTNNENAIKGHQGGQKAILYYLVAIYIGYMGYSILHNRLSGDNTMSYPLAIILTSVFIIGAAWVAWYATKGLKYNLKQSETDETEKEEQN
jgi:hypothetical protein